ncbi:hypothetical protein [Ascidiimonas sp. W6]|uniref:hypothetical protein n=1 Tax=Ascidiimonas meishanensis TaxID=3128903 RepID=UPI0030EE8FDD
MVVSEFTYLLQNPGHIDPGQTAELEKVLEAYPYFQAAAAIHLKGLKNLESFKYNQALKKTASLTTDRAILFDFITSKEFKQNSIAEAITEHSLQLSNIPVEVEEIKAEDRAHIPEEYLGSKSDANAVLDPGLFQPKDPERDVKIEMGKPLEFSRSEKHSFSEWLKLSAAKPIERKEDTSKEIQLQKKGFSEKERKFALIERFISTNPKIVPSKEQIPNINLATENKIEAEGLMTETLARVYVEQKKYKKAVQAFKILSLKYPEKSGFFADQIKAIKRIQQNN